MSNRGRISGGEYVKPDIAGRQVTRQACGTQNAYPTSGWEGVNNQEYVKLAHRRQGPHLGSYCNRRSVDSDLVVEVFAQVVREAKIAPMQQIVFGEIRTSKLGFGCGSVLGRVGRSGSLRAMNAAWNEGITLFETAPSYGFGEAEPLLGSFLRGKRRQATVITKYGIPAQRLAPLQRLALPLARMVRNIQTSAGLRTGKVHDVRPAVSGQFTVKGMRTSIELSLHNLQTDYIDILLLHNPSSDITLRDDVIIELDALTREGKLRRAGLYADPAVVTQALKQSRSPLSVMEVGFDPFGQAPSVVAAAADSAVMLLANHPFGSVQRVERFRAALHSLSKDPRLPGELSAKLRDPDWQVVLEATLELALAPQRFHALIFSMMQPDHLLANVRALENSRFSEADVALMRRHIFV